MRVHLVDGTYELFRAHYSKRPDHFAPDGADRKATVGVVSSLLQLLHDPGEDVTHLAVAFDNPIRSFRNDVFAGYKGDAGVAPELRAQFDAVERAVWALGVVVWSMAQYEADDALATGARRYAGAVDQVRLLTPDKDLGQCLSGTRVVQLDRRQRKETDEAAFRALRGFGPRSMPDFLALTGDPADGIPGLPGWGAKSAGTVLGRYEHLEAIPELAHQWDVKVRGALGLATTLVARRDDALLYRKLATLVDTVPLEDSLDDLRFQGVPRERFEPWAEAVGLPKLTRVPERWKA